MRAVAFAEFGDGNAVETRERPDPEPGPREAVVDARACSINRHI